jgi:hypothetical protein
MVRILDTITCGRLRQRLRNAKGKASAQADASRTPTVQVLDFGFWIEKRLSIVSLKELQITNNLVIKESIGYWLMILIVSKHRFFLDFP